MTDNFSRFENVIKMTSQAHTFDHIKDSYLLPLKMIAVKVPLESRAALSNIRGFKVKFCTHLLLFYLQCSGVHK